ncbi:unnamed protein product [Chrysoparadoxa australica]
MLRIRSRGPAALQCLLRYQSAPHEALVRGFAAGPGPGSWIDRLKEGVQGMAGKTEGASEKWEEVKQKVKEQGEKVGEKTSGVSDRWKEVKQKAKEQGDMAQQVMKEQSDKAKEKLGVGGDDGEGKGGEDFVTAAKKSQKGGKGREGMLGRIVPEGFVEGAQESFREMLGMKRKEVIRKKLPKGKKAGEPGEGGAIPEEQVGALVLVKTLSDSWKKARDAIKKAPVIEDVLAGGRATARATGLDKGSAQVKSAVKDKVEDMQETWETSQHPLVYKASSAWDSMAGENEQGTAVRMLRRLDPGFTIEDFKADLQEHLLPEIIGAYLAGRSDVLQDWCTDGVFGRLSQEIALRQQNGYRMDPNVLDVDNTEVIAVKFDADRTNPSIILSTMVQRVNCVWNKKGEVIEGNEDKVQAVFYILTMQRAIEQLGEGGDGDAEHELRWKVQDFGEVSSLIAPNLIALLCSWLSFCYPFLNAS